jgi:hypothetical protein
MRKWKLTSDAISRYCAAEAWEMCDVRVEIPFPLFLLETIPSPPQDLRPSQRWLQRILSSGIQHRVARYLLHKEGGRERERIPTP